MLLPDLLTEAARRFPHKDAAVFPDERIGFAALDRAARQVAARLRRLGVGPKRRVAILHENALPALAFFWGALRAGAEAVDIPSLAGPASIASMLEECRPSVLAVQPHLWDKLGPEGLRAAPEIVFTTAGGLASARRAVSLETMLAEDTPTPDGPEVAPSDVAVIVYTSGSTGRAKGVMLSHDNLLSNIVAFNSRIQLTAEDSLLVVVPLHFIHGRVQLLTHAMIGGTLFFSRGFQFPSVVLDELQSSRATGISGVPYHFATLLARTRLGSAPLPHLRNVTITGGAPSAELMRGLRDALPGVRLHLNYGLTEASPRLTYLGPGEDLARPGSCGRALPGVSIAILDDDGAPTAPGAIGHVVAGGPGIMKGYVSGDERASGRIDPLGRLHTGDLGRVDEDGYLYLTGRSSEMIKCAGERIFPGEVEEALSSFPGVVEVAVCGAPDPLLGEKVVAWVVTADGVEVAPSELRAHCLGSLPFVRTPREIRIVPSLPRTASGKIARAALRATLAQADGGEAREPGPVPQPQGRMRRSPG